MDLNDIVQIILTQKGADIVNKRNKDINAYNVHRNFKTDYKAEDMYSDQLWEIFNIFGDHCNIGEDLPFKSMKLKRKP